MNDRHPSLDRLIDYLHDELSPSDDAAIHAHVSACAACSAARDREVALSELLRRHAAAAERDMPPGLRTAILANAQPGRPFARRWAPANLWRTVIGVPLAAAAALAIYVATTAPNASNAALDASSYVNYHAALSSTAPFQGGEPLAAQLTADEPER